MKFLSRYAFAIMLFLIACLYGYNFFTNGTESLWSDEAFSANLAQENIATIISVSSQDTLPPLHLLTLHLWMKLGGSGELVARAVSLLFTVGSVFLMYELLKKIFKKKSEHIIGLLLFCCNPLTLYYAIEARAYSMLVFFTLLLVVSILNRIEKSSLRNTIIYILAAVGGLYTHTIFIIIFGVSTLWELVLYFKNKKIDKKTILQLSASYFSIGLLFSPWMITMMTVAQRANSDGFWLQFNPFSDLFSTYTYFLIGFTNNSPILETIKNPLYILGGIIFMLGVFNKIKNYYFFELFFSLLFSVWLVSFKLPLFYVRYLIFILPFFTLLLAQGIAIIKNKYPTLAYVIVFLFITTQLYIYFTTLPPKTPYREVVASLDILKADEIILHPSAVTFHGFKYYRQPGYVYTSSREAAYYEGIAALKQSEYFSGDFSNYKTIYVLEKWEYPEFDFELTNKGYIKTHSKQFEDNLYLDTWSKEAS